jgi:hypothetical protein
MKALAVSILIASVAIGPAAFAKDNPSGQGLGHLKQALGAAAASTVSQGPPPPEHFNPKTSNGQGAVHANPGAIAKVCSKDTPAAHRAAICQVGVSPE